MLGWSAGCASSGLRLDCCCADRQALDMTLICKKNQKKKGSARVSPVAASMPKSVSFLEEREIA